MTDTVTAAACLWLVYTDISGKHSLIFSGTLSTTDVICSLKWNSDIMLEFFLYSSVFIQTCFGWVAVKQHSLDFKWIQISTYNPFLGVFANLRKAILASLCLSPSVRPHKTTRLPLDGFSLSMIFEYFSKICQKIPVSLNRTRIMCDLHEG